MWHEMVDRKCPVCGSADASRVFAETNIDLRRLDTFAFASRKLPEYMHHRLITCPTCELLYASPVPSTDGLASAYADAAFDSSDEARYASRTYARAIRKLVVDALPDRDGALDIGTGDGAFLAELLSLGFTNVAGVEPSAAPVAAAGDRIRPLIRQGMFAESDFQRGRFSLITCFQTIEHLPAPLAVCQAANRLLKPGGALVLIGHNRRALSAWLLGRKSPIFDLEHLQLFSHRSVSSLLQRSGFETTQVKPLLNRYPLHYWLKLLPLPRRLKLMTLERVKDSVMGQTPVVLPAGNLLAIGFKSRAAAVGAA